MRKKLLAVLMVMLLLAIPQMAAASVTTIIYTGGVTETCTLANLANSTTAGRACLEISNLTNADVDGHVYVTVVTNASGTSATGFIAIYFYACVNATATCGDGGAGTDSNVTLTNPPNLLRGAGPPCNAVANATTYVCGPYSVAQTFGGTLPAGWGTLVQNQSGAALDVTCTGCGVKYDRIRVTNN